MQGVSNFVGFQRQGIKIYGEQTNLPIMFVNNKLRARACDNHWCNRSQLQIQIIG